MDNENTKPSGFGGFESSETKPKRAKKKKVDSDLIMGIETAPVEEKKPEVKVEPVVEPPAPSAPTPPAPVVATGRTKPHRIFPSRYRP